MSFTDEDLKRLKDRLEHEDCHQTVTLWELAPLLARLEAAEKAADYADGADKGEVDACELRLAIKEWRKEAGK